MEETITISLAEYKEMEKRIFYLECLEAGGVDNWDCGDALDPYFERYAN